MGSRRGPTCFHYCANLRPVACDVGRDDACSHPAFVAVDTVSHLVIPKDPPGMLLEGPSTHAPADRPAVSGAVLGFLTWWICRAAQKHRVIAAAMRSPARAATGLSYCALMPLMAKSRFRRSQRLGLLTVRLRYPVLPAVLGGDSCRHGRVLTDVVLLSFACSCAVTPLPVVLVILALMVVVVEALSAPVGAAVCRRAPSALATTRSQRRGGRIPLRTIGARPTTPTLPPASQRITKTTFGSRT